MTKNRTLAGISAASLLALALAACGGNPAGSSPSPAAAATPAPTPTPGTTAIFDGKWSGTTGTGGGVSFRVLSGQVMDLALDIDLGGGCVYRAKTPSSFDPVDPMFPIGTDAKVSFRFHDPALSTGVAIEFTAVRAAKGTFDSTDLLGVVTCAGQTISPPKRTPAGTFTVSRP